MSRIPPALQPYLALPPEASLILLTGTLGCSTTWITTRFIASLLSPSAGVDSNILQIGHVAPEHDAQEQETSHTAVILASWLRDVAFWKTEILRTTRIDVSKSLARNNVSFHFLPQLTFPVPPLSSLPTSIASITSSLPSKTANVILLLDAPELALFLAPTSANALNTTLLECRSKVFATVVCTTADQPFLSAAASAAATATAHDQGGPVATPLEIETAAFVVAQAHAARMVMSVRELDTGAAKDVSGVLRVTRGGGGGADEEEEDDGAVGAGLVKEMEALYLVQRDGNVKSGQNMIKDEVTLVEHERGRRHEIEELFSAFSMQRALAPDTSAFA
nr:hypothetical protein CFP56_20553 [Quercus suber]